MSITKTYKVQSFVIETGDIGITSWLRDAYPGPLLCRRYSPGLKRAQDCRARHILYASDEQLFTRRPQSGRRPPPPQGRNS